MSVEHPAVGEIWATRHFIDQVSFVRIEDTPDHGAFVKYCEYPKKRVSWTTLLNVFMNDYQLMPAPGEVWYSRSNAKPGGEKHLVYVLNAENWGVTFRYHPDGSDNARFRYTFQGFLEMYCRLEAAPVAAPIHNAWATLLEADAF
jgi:hypothetical protein